MCLPQLACLFTACLRGSHAAATPFPCASRALSLFPLPPLRLVLQEADASLADVQALHHLPHLLFALLRSPLLQARASAAGGREGTAAGAVPAAWRHPDAAAVLRSLLRVLPPDEVRPHLRLHLLLFLARPARYSQLHVTTSTRTRPLPLPPDLPSLPAAVCGRLPPAVLLGRPRRGGGDAALPV